jgi:hypothetical protein
MKTEGNQDLSSNAGWSRLTAVLHVVDRRFFQNLYF